MKAAAIITLILLIAALVGVGYLYMESGITAVSVSVEALPASDWPEQTAELQRQAASQALVGTPLGTALPEDPSQCTYYTYTVTLQNKTFLTADMVEIQVTPVGGDILQLGTESTYALPAQSTGSLSATILTSPGLHSVRELTVTYYFWGRPFQLRTTAR